MSIKLRQVRNSAQMVGAVGIPLEVGVQQVAALMIDNYSGYWFNVGNGAAFVPPYTIGWVLNLDGSMAGSLNVVKGTPGPRILNPAAGQDGTVIATVYDNFLSPSSGFTFLAVPFNSRVFPFVAQAAATVNMFFAPAGTSFDSGLIEMVVTGGTIGRCNIRVRDNAGAGTAQDLFEGVAVPTVVTTTQVNLGGSPVNLDPLRPTWAVQAQFVDIAGVNAFNGSITIQFH